jgi:calcineurin-like phosphoesterase family protein
MNYYISDLHLFSMNQLDNGGRNYDGRKYRTLEEMHGDIKKRWNDKVTNGDRVYILGDVAVRGRNDDLIALTAQLKGKKVLIRGNHDDINDLRYKQLFTGISDYEEIYDSFGGRTYRLVLCHYPILMWNGQHKGSILLYGHTHDSAEDGFFQDCIRRMNENPEIRRDGDTGIQGI